MTCVLQMEHAAQGRPQWVSTRLVNVSRSLQSLVSTAPIIGRTHRDRWRLSGFFFSKTLARRCAGRGFARTNERVRSHVSSEILCSTYFSDWSIVFPPKRYVTTPGDERNVLKGISTLLRTIIKKSWNFFKNMTKIGRGWWRRSFFFFPKNWPEKMQWNSL